MLASGSYDGTIRLWEVYTGTGGAEDYEGEGGSTAQVSGVEAAMFSRSLEGHKGDVRYVMWCGYEVWTQSCFVGYGI